MKINNDNKIYIKIGVDEWNKKKIKDFLRVSYIQIFFCYLLYISFLT